MAEHESVGAELANRQFEAFNRRDLDALLALMDDDVEFHSRLVEIEGGYRGHEGIRRWWANLFEIWPDFTIESVEIRDLGAVTLALLRNRGHAVGSGAPFEQTLWQVGKWRDRKLVWLGSYEMEADALEAARLRGLTGP